MGFDDSPHWTWDHALPSSISAVLRHLYGPTSQWNHHFQDGISLR
jgi:hypothetical protein